MIKWDEKSLFLARAALGGVPCCHRHPGSDGKSAEPNVLHADQLSTFANRSQLQLLCMRAYSERNQLPLAHPPNKTRKILISKQLLAPVNLDAFLRDLKKSLKAWRIPPPFNYAVHPCHPSAFRPCVGHLHTVRLHAASCGSICGVSRARSLWRCGRRCGRRYAGDPGCD